MLLLLLACRPSTQPDPPGKDSLDSASTVLCELLPTPGDPSALVEDSVTYAVQVMGKVRGKLEIAKDAGKDDVLAAAKALPNVERFLEGKTIRKEIFVPGRLVNFVAT